MGAVKIRRYAREIGHDVSQSAGRAYKHFAKLLKKLATINLGNLRRKARRGKEILAQESASRAQTTEERAESDADSRRLAATFPRSLGRKMGISSGGWKSWFR